MLWIAWAKVRDASYWETQHALIGYGRRSEEWDWAPLLGRLNALGYHRAIRRHLIQRQNGFDDQYAGLYPLGKESSVAHTSVRVPQYE